VDTNEREEIYQQLARLLTPAQVELIMQSLYEVRRSSGFGRVYIDLQAGTVKYIGVDIRRSA